MRGVQWSAALPAWLMLASLVTLAGLTVLRARRWRAGRPAEVNVLRGLAALPKRYLVDVHAVVARRPRNAWMHALLAGGVVTAAMLSLFVHLGRLGGVAAWLLLAALLPACAGLALLLVRRWKPVPALTRRGFARLPFAFAAFLIFEIAVLMPRLGFTEEIRWSSPAGLLLAALGIYAFFELVVAMSFGPMKHALHGALHLAFHPRPTRFDAPGPDAALLPLALDASGRLGVQTPTDMPWNRLLSFDACVECGRCEEACPAFAAGLPLNPKQLVQTLVIAQDAAGTATRYAGRRHDGETSTAARGGFDRPLVGDQSLISPHTLWACTTCRACVQECPMLIEHVDAIVDMRRFQTLEAGAVPGKAPQALESLRVADTLGGQHVADRLDWAADLYLPLLADVKQCDVLLWLGNGAFEADGQRTLRALVRLLRQAQVDFAVLGAEELDCGDLARRLGDEATFQSLAVRNIERLARYRFKRVLTADPHALHTLRNEYPTLGGRYDVVHHTTLLAQLLTDGKLRAQTSLLGRSLTYHDPCYLARYNGEVAAPRAILARLGAEVREMDRSGLKAMCCGGGGGAPLTDVVGKRRVPDVRMEQIRATRADIVAVACPGCAVMLGGVGQPRPAVRDVAELLADAVAEDP